MGTLDKAQLETDLLSLFNDASTIGSDTPLDRRRHLANRMAAAIDAFVKSGTVNVNVVTTGTATNHTGTGTGNVT